MTGSPSSTPSPDHKKNPLAWSEEQTRQLESERFRWRFPKLAVLALLAGIIALVVPLVGLLGIVLGVISLVMMSATAKQGSQPTPGLNAMAIIGICLGAFPLWVWVWVTLVFDGFSYSFWN
ncbi:DUF4190 domain-containing protein [Leucobacter coleopterorum]|uniref:DUF4190 domain-containing protein n=1 Tax=Leucobacter coleopterorum TaxID=2714933 RepID=A0ABX6JYI0_9MICO|nr:DUF4190 domain-containing protein [Leucobacter coleopterorum]QIM19371.1 DUF4190 domain-containing protein [Leucobacter coleopterorum]